ncbi:hypothetical protein [Mammaliicoccus sp. G-M31]|uniref:hypothetical protein n=1 Tax=Mammaliicoccus sp. G-M31 TaxID=2898690 RepID=UPI001EFA7642|nr:hypothetical protein [Mammaliicoccus sp. G-M31]
MDFEIKLVDGSTYNLNEQEFKDTRDLMDSDATCIEVNCYIVDDRYELFLPKSSILYIRQVL